VLVVCGGLPEEAKKLSQLAHLEHFISDPALALFVLPNWVGGGGSKVLNKYFRFSLVSLVFYRVRELCLSVLYT
jgi:hypothetical protein